MLLKDCFCLSKLHFIIEQSTLGEPLQCNRELKGDKINGQAVKEDAAKASVIEHSKDFIATALFSEATAY